jgi:hypothetical protein
MASASPISEVRYLEVEEAAWRVALNNTAYATTVLIGVVGCLSCYRCLQSTHSPMCIVMSISLFCAMRAIWLHKQRAAHPSAGVQFHSTAQCDDAAAAGRLAGLQTTCQPSLSPALLLRLTNNQGKQNTAAAHP